MRFDIQSMHLGLDHGVLDLIRRRFEHGLDQFTHYILGGRILLSDVNGPKGGVDKRCRVLLRLRWAQAIVIEENGAELPRVIGRAADRLAASVGRAVERAKHRYTQVYRRRLSC